MTQVSFTAANLTLNISEAVAQTKLRSFLSRDLLKNRKLSSFIDWTAGQFVKYFESKGYKKNRLLSQVYDTCLSFILGAIIPAKETPVIVSAPVAEPSVFPLDSWKNESLWFQLTHTVDAILNLLVEKGVKRVDIKAKRAIKYFQSNQTLDEIAKAENKTQEAVRLAIKRDIIDKILSGTISQDCLVNFSISPDFLRQIRDIRQRYILQDSTTIETAIGCPKGILAKSNYKDFLEGDGLTFSNLNCKTALSPLHNKPLYHIIVSIDKQLSVAFGYQSVSDFWRGIKKDNPKIAECKEHTDFIYHWLSNNPLVETDGRGGYRLKASALTIGYVRQARIIYDSKEPIKLGQISAIHKQMFGELSFLSTDYLHNLGFVCADYRWHHPMSPNHSLSSSTVA